MRSILRLVKLILLVTIIYVAARYVMVFFDSQLLGDRAVYFQKPTDTSIVARWQTKSHALGIVRYGEEKDYLEQLGIEASRRKIHSIELNGLKPGTRYFYTIGDVDGPYESQSGDSWFQTLPAVGDHKATRIWVMGDSGLAGQTAISVRDAMKQWVVENPRQTASGSMEENLDVWLALGDLAYPSGSDADFQTGLFDAYPELLSGMAISPVYGHLDARHLTYFKIFDLPEKAELGGVASDSENYYSFNYANIHFVVLDSQESSADSDSAMLNWLQRDLDHNRKTWLIAAFHHPPYTKGDHDSDDAADSGGRMIRMREKVLPLLENAGVDLVLSGHSHVYERSYLLDCHYQDSASFSSKNIVSKGRDGKHKNYRKPIAKRAHQGTIYAVVGSSSTVGEGALNHPAHKVSLSEAGSLVIDVDGKTLTSRFINENGEVRDVFSITKDEAYISTYSGCDG